jgi:catechol 2,3-dioxygenase-like lactoylglutathione lyase family enzyme
MKLTRSTLFLSAAALLLAAGMARRPRYRAQRILRISRVASDLGRAEAFYRDGLGFQAIARGRPGKAALAALGLGDADAEEVVMRLGTQDIALVRFTVPGRPYPRDSRSDDLWFQHLAIVVDDMDVAYARLCAHGEWRPISEAGPQLLPPSNGAVRAFKFRDPDGHPLELIWFPPGQGRAAWQEDHAAGPFLGIDHSALSVASTRRSLRFYRALGLRVSNRSLNRGPAQARLDGLPDARVRVTGVRPASVSAGPRLELLSYHPPGRPDRMTHPNDLATDWVTLAVRRSPGGAPCAVRDPDGHLLVLVDQGTRDAMTLINEYSPLLLRICLVVLFPFSGLDKIINWDSAMKQAGNIPFKRAMLVASIAVECVAPVCIVTGKRDRLAAVTLGAFCVITAALFHQFWRFPDFWRFREGEGLQHFWEFLKNFGLVGGLGLIGLAPRTLPASEAVQHPLASTHVVGPQAGSPVAPAP